jgi:hypothetical protein
LPSNRLKRRVLILNIKQIANIGILGGLVIALYLTLTPLYLFPFLITVLILKKWDALIFSLIVAFLTFFVSGRIETLSNLIWLPMMAITIKSNDLFLYGGRLQDGCLSNPKMHHHIRLGLLTGGLILLANIGSEIIAMVTLDLGWEYLIASLPIALIGAMVNAILISFLGIYLQRRLSKILLRLQS